MNALKERIVGVTTAPKRRHCRASITALNATRGDQLLKHGAVSRQEGEGEEIGVPVARFRDVAHARVEAHVSTGAGVHQGLGAVVPVAQGPRFDQPGKHRAHGRSSVDVCQ